MKCPHCLVEFHDKPEEVSLARDADGWWVLVKRLCPACDKFVMHLQARSPGGRLTSEYLVRPKAAGRAPAPSEVPPEFATDYAEACLVLPDSPKASAALSRRCLQHLLREKACIKPGNLGDEIQQVLDGGRLPSHLAEAIDGVRNTGNFAAHPIKSQSTGEVVSVEPGEAEWNLDVLYSLFDFYFVQPETLRRKREALNQKLKDAGKPPMKGSSQAETAP